MRVFADVEGPVRAWLRASTTVNAVAAQRVYLGTPKGGPQAGPWITLALVNNIPLSGRGVPQTTALMQIDCWAAARADAASLAAAVVSAAETLTNGDSVGNLRGYGASVQRHQWAPDPASNVARYSLDVAFQLIAPQGG